MSLFQCENCGCAENTALSLGGCVDNQDKLDWTGKEHLKGKKVCSACAPEKFSSVSKFRQMMDDQNNIKREMPLTGLGKWHGKFERIFLAMGEFVTSPERNLRHISQPLTKKDENGKDVAIEFHSDNHSDPNNEATNKYRVKKPSHVEN